MKPKLDITLAILTMWLALSAKTFTQDRAIDPEKESLQKAFEAFAKTEIAHNWKECYGCFVIITMTE